MPGINFAEVNLKWPNVVSIEISETEPVALWKQNGRTYWIDETGRLIPSRTGTPGLLMIESEEDATLTEDAFVADDVLVGALRLRDRAETWWYGRCLVRMERPWRADLTTALPSVLPARGSLILGQGQHSS